MKTTFFVVLAILLVIIVGGVILLYLFSPEGYQDDEGFHEIKD